MVELRIDTSYINEQMEMYDDSVIDYACEENMIDTYSENLLFLKEQWCDESFILQLFFECTDSFFVSNKTFKLRINLIKDELRDKFEEKISDTFYETGGSKIFCMIGWLTTDNERWLAELKKEKEKL